MLENKPIKIIRYPIINPKTIRGPIINPKTICGDLNKKTF